MGAPMRPIDVGLIAEFLGYVQLNRKHCLSTVGASSSSSVPRVQTVHTKLDHMERVLDYHGQLLVYQNELLLQQREY